MKSLLVLPLFLLLLVPVTASTPVHPQQSPQAPLIQMVNSTHGNALGGKIFVNSCSSVLPPCLAPQGATCYFPIVVNDTITFTGNTTYTISLQAFTLIVVSFSAVESNSTNFAAVSPNNQMSGFTMLQSPNNVVLLIVSFPRTCIFGTIQTVSLIYNDGPTIIRLI